MPSILDKIRAALRRPINTTAQLADALADAKKADADARAAVEAQAAKVSAGFLDPEATRATDRATLAAAREAAEDAAAVLAEVERRLAAAQTEAEQERRRGVYTAARARAVEASAALAKDYPRIVRDLKKILRALAEAQRDVNVANAQLPNDAAPIIDPESITRSIGHQQAEVVKEEIVERWVGLDHHQPAQEHCPGLKLCGDRKYDHRNPRCAADGCQAEILPAGKGWGKRRGDLEPCFLRARFRRTEYREAVFGIEPKPLALALKLPALMGDGMAWGEQHYVGPDPDHLAALRGHGSPDAVLTRLDALDVVPPAGSKAVQRPIKVAFEMVGYVDALPLKPGPKSYRSTEGENPNRQPDVEPRPIASDMAGLPGMSVPGTGVPVTPRFGASPFSADGRR